MQKNRSILTIFVSLFFAMIVLPFVAGVYIENSTYRKLMLGNATKSIMGVMSQLSNSIEDEIKRLELLSSTIAYDNDLMNLVLQYRNEWDADAKELINKQIKLRLNYLFHNSDNIESVIFFYENEGFYNYRGTLISDEKDIRRSDWYAETMKNAGNVSIYSSLENITYNFNTYILSNKYVFSVLTTPFIPKYMNNIDLIYTSYRTSIFQNYYSTLNLEELGQMSVVDENGRIIFSNDKSLIGQIYDNFSYIKSSSTSITKENGVKKIINIYTIPVKNWSIINSISYNELIKDSNKIVLYMLVFGSFMCAFFMLYLIVFVKRIIKPINIIASKMNIVNDSNFDIKVDIKTKIKEIDLLSETFNNMIDNIKELMRERDIKEQEKIKVEIDVLQSQINPHFLSNTLNSIRLMAMISKVDSIKEMTEALINLFKASFWKSKNYYTIDTEISTLRSYEYIMKFRYGDKFTVEYQIDGNILCYSIPKLLLQPILENSILHGVGINEYSGIIRISGAKQEDSIVFEIFDNGVGITKERITELLEQESSCSFGIGIYNVNKRIKMNFGEQYGVVIESEINRYTKVTITIPAIVRDVGD